MQTNIYYHKRTNTESSMRHVRKTTDYKIDYVNKIYYNDTRAYIQIYVINEYRRLNSITRYMVDVCIIYYIICTTNRVHVYLYKCRCKMIIQNWTGTRSEFGAIALLTNTEVCETHSKVVIIYV